MVFAVESKRLGDFGRRWRLVTECWFDIGSPGWADLSLILCHGCGFGATAVALSLVLCDCVLFSFASQKRNAKVVVAPINNPFKE